MFNNDWCCVKRVIQKIYGCASFFKKQKAVVPEAHNSKLGEYYWVGDNKTVKNNKIKCLFNHH